MITLRFVSHHSLLGPLFRLAQAGAKWTHVEAVTVEGYIGAMLMGGVQERSRDYDRGGFENEIFVNLKATPEQEKAFFAFLQDKIGQPYDPIAVLYFFGFFADRHWEDPGAWECTECIAAALIACGWLPDNPKIPACRMTPWYLYGLTSTIAARGSNV